MYCDVRLLDFVIAISRAKNSRHLLVAYLRAEIKTPDIVYDVDVIIHMSI